MNKPLHIRWMIKRDLPEVLAIEKAAFEEYPWLEDDFVRYLRQTNCIGMVVEYEDAVIGFMVYELNKTSIHVYNFAVDPWYQRQGVGRAMIDKLKGKLSEIRRTRIVLEIREENLDGQLFFKSMGFMAIAVLQEFYADANCDAYLMAYSILYNRHLNHFGLDSGHAKRHTTLA